jgi:hypothetical protein
MKAKITYQLFTHLFFTLFLLGCSGSKTLSTVTPENGFTGAKLVEAEFIIRIDSIKTFDADSLRKSNEKYGIASDNPPTLLIWCSDIIDYDNQRVSENIISETLPTEIFTDFENENKICFWDLSNRLNDTTSIIIRRKFSYYTYNYSPKLDTNAVFENYNSVPQELFNFYTKSEPSLEQNPEIIKTANQITFGEKTILRKAKNIFNWVYSNMHYKFPPEKRGVLEAISKLEGDCGQYSALFITLCRCVGIPARQQSGFTISGGKFGYHVWSEVYLPGLGWIPMDTTIPDGLGKLPNDRLIASIGMNILLKYVPIWSTYDHQDAQDGRTDFMQFMTMVRSGFSAKISTERNLLHFKNMD